MNTKILPLIFAILIETTLARSQSTLAWHFDRTDFIVQPADHILLTGTVSNSSATPYTIPGGGAMFTGDLQKSYDLTWLLNVFNRTVPAYGTLQFDFGTLTPVGGYVQPGIYQADPAAINFTQFDLQYSDNTFQITVVPEPSIMCLGGVGLACLFMLRLLKNRVSDEMTMPPDKCAMKITRHLPRWNLCWAFLGIAFPVFGGPLDTWTSVPSGTTNHLCSVAFGGGLFVAAGDAGTVLTSPNGIVWTPVAPGITNSLRGVAYGQGHFVSAGASGVVITSNDGVAWSLQSSGTLNQLNAVASTDPGFVAAGNLGTILTSSDGSNWVVQTSGTSAPFVGVGVGFGRIFAGAEVNPPALFWSTNGSAWSYMTNVPPNLQPDLFNGGFAVGDGVMLGIRIRGLFCRSLDGDTWTHYSSPFFYCFGLAHARHTFVTVGGNFSGGGRTIGTSTNGINWQTRYFKSNEGRLLSVAYGNHRFVAVGDNGSILASDPMLWISNPSVTSNALQMTLNGEAGGVYHIQRNTNVSTPFWNDVGVVTNLGDAIELTVPFAADSPSAVYRASAH